MAKKTKDYLSQAQIRAKLFAAEEEEVLVLSDDGKNFKRQNLASD
jgi:hypothetical protein